MLIVSDQDREPHSYPVAPAAASGLSRLGAGDRVRLRLSEELTVCVPRAGLEQRGSEETLCGKADARVLSVDASYRVLTLQYPNGRTESFKLGLGARMREMEPGDVVLIRPIEIIAIRRARS